MLGKLKKMLDSVNPPVYVVKKTKRREDPDGRVVAYVDRNSYIAEQYRVLRTSLYSLAYDKPIKTIAITSSQSGEGKSTTSSNLAVTLAADPEKKVLLVDGDLRKPELNKLLKRDRSPGLSDVITGKMDINELLTKPVIDNLYFVPSGSPIPNPSELLRHSRVKKTIEDLKARFDYIIFDTPPTLNVTDSCVIGSMCDGVLLVVKAEVTQKSIIEEAFSILKNAQARPLGCILVNFHIPLYYAYKYKRYYKYK